MVPRICKLPNQHSFFLFGARGTGKTTLLNEHYQVFDNPRPDTLFLDLLDPDVEELFSKNPNLLRDQLKAGQHVIKRIIIDEVQKIPALLDVVQALIERNKQVQFILTGSSARKLKHGAGNLLGGRAFTVNLYPFSHLEIKPNDDLLEILTWGTLPKLYEFNNALDKIRFLRTYTQTYLKQEIQLEQLVRNIVSFREFLDLAAQCSGETVNFSNISNKSGVDDKTIARYFEILVDTLIGYFLEPFDESVRVRQSLRPRFYLFDTGIKRYLSQDIELPVKIGSSEYGRLFEQWIICECFRLNDYFEKNYRFYYLVTKDGAEIDLIVQKPGKRRILIEIKSAADIQKDSYRHLIRLGKDIHHQEKWVIANVTRESQTEEGVRILPWRSALQELFLGEAPPVEG